ncbi:uncharacterized protein BO88DRAFT_54394 [Aspergillus vadensis CBS 113365]|uniref:Uncharacterized protein n=1 Tax=Aspergillus vadensis (strain CBS 113365 / IMI 142717 / IBT 24658) TaxID=1448311 RepID=A0A319BAF7_ASPVC|nr:hypothetical protein BO88DRAFT_54394 [Aspergillus vadensis CBS 113365]PYH68941.1 hypothetical protein BO88DRAFT_54394 [Aspergillus vadensis CBS 113365]
MYVCMYPLLSVSFYLPFNFFVSFLLASARQCRLTYQQANSMIGMGYYYYSHQLRGSKGDEKKSRIVKRARVGKGSGKLTRATTRTRQKGLSHGTVRTVRNSFPKWKKRAPWAGRKADRAVLCRLSYPYLTSSIPQVHSELRGNRDKLLPTSVSGAYGESSSFLFSPGFTVGERARVEEGGERGGELGTALPVMEQSNKKPFSKRSRQTDW